MNKPIVGHNISISNNGLVSSADYAEELDAGVYQIFLSSPQDYKLSYHPQSKLNELKNKLIEKNIKIVVHANYMLNFCNPVDDKKHIDAIKLLVSDLNDSVVFNSIGVIIHMGKKLTMSEDVAINNYVLGIKNALNKSHKDSVIIFETGAGVGTEVCTSITDLGKLYKRFTKDEKKDLNFVSTPVTFFQLVTI